MNPKAEKHYDIADKADDAGDFKTAVTEYENALRYLDRNKEPEDYAMTQNNLGNAYCDLPTGDRDANMRRAIECYEKALEIRTKDAFPEKFADTQNNLGIAYRNLPTGDRGENIRRAIECYEKVLEIRTKDAFPEKNAMTHNNLGAAYKNLPTGDRGENIRRAIECYEKALEIRTKDSFPSDFAMTQNNLGIAYCDLPTGDRDANSRRAIECFEKALEIYTKDAFTEKFADIQNNLGVAYKDLPTGDRGENIKRAIEYFKKALEIRTKDAFPSDFAMTQNNLGLAYAELESGDRIRNLEKALECHRQAAEGYEAVGLTEKAKSQNSKIKTLENLIKIENEKIQAEQSGDENAAESAEEKGELTEAVDKIRDVLMSFGTTEEERKTNLLDEISRNKKQLDEYLKGERTLTDGQSELIVLRRFNSYTPILSFGTHQSRGGGYFLVSKGKGLVIDPGFNFIQNFHEAGFSIEDIDAVIVTHAHNDHTVDLESLVSLLLKRNKLKVGKPKIPLYLNRTAAVKFCSWLDLKREVFKDIHIINPDDEAIVIFDGLKVSPVKAEHTDIVSGDGALGYVFEFKGKQKKRVFFTGDSKCNKNYFDRCKNLLKTGKIHLLVPHLGTIDETEFNYTMDPNFDMDTCAPTNHLGILGVARLIQGLKPGLTLLSEFGEEFKSDIRYKITEKLTQVLKCNVLAADVGLRVQLDTNKIRCLYCDEYFPFNKTKTGYKPGSYSQYNALYYYCENHKFDELEKKVSEIYK